MASFTLSSHTDWLATIQEVMKLGSVTTAPTVHFDPASHEFAWHAYDRYADLREQSPVVRLLQPDGTEIWLVVRYDDARAALADPRLSKDTRGARQALEEAGLVSPPEPTEPGAPAPPTGRLTRPDMLYSDPPEHTRLRRLVSRAFSPRRIERLRPQIEALAEDLLDKMAGEDEPDLLSAFAFPLPLTVICELLGVPDSDRGRVRRWVNLMMSTDPELDRRIDPLEQTFAQYLSELIRIAAPQVRHDLIEDEQPSLVHALILASEDQDRLTEAEIIENLILLLGAGHETTANLIGNGTLALLRHPDQLDLLRRHPEMLPNAVEELLRYDGSVERATFRISREPVTIGGVTIPAHRMVGVVIASADRDPDHFEDPDRLDIARPCAPHVGFGRGIHFCLGAPLARLEAQIAFGHLLERFPDLELACPVEDLRFRAAGYLIRGLRTLPVRLHRTPRTSVTDQTRVTGNDVNQDEN